MFIVMGAAVLFATAVVGLVYMYGGSSSSIVNLLQALHVSMTQDKNLPDLGSRKRKVWFKLRSSENNQPYLLSMAEVPACHGYSNTTCRDHIRSQLSDLQRLSHGHLQPLHVLCLCSKKGEVLAGGAVSRDMRGSRPVREMPLVTELQVAMIEIFHEKGSIKDYMHRVSPTLEWSDKYAGTTTPLAADRVAVFGQQILQAVLYLYDKVPESMRPLGHIRIQNIYVDISVETNGVCKVGGYGNTFLGYENSLLKRVKEDGHTNDSVDVIMFGHVMYYMCTGVDIKLRTRIVTLPGEEHFTAVPDMACRKVLRYIFKMQHDRIKHSLNDIFEHQFFAN